MYSFIPTIDKALIKEVLTSANNIPFAFSDEIDIASFDVNLRDDITIIKVAKDSELFGLLFIIKINDSVADLHLAFLPGAYGKTRKICSEFIEYIWKNTHYSDLTCCCLPENRLAGSLIESVGFIKIGVEDRAWLKDGIWHNFNLYHLHNNTIESQV